MTNLSKFSVNYPVTIVMMVLAVLLLGYISFNKLGIELLPELNNPRIFVEIKSGEKPPEEMEQQYVANIEALASRQKKVVQVSSVSRVGVAQITVEYSWDADMNESLLDLQKTLTSFSQNVELDEMTVTQHDPNAIPVMLLGFSHPNITDMDELRRVADSYIRNELIRLEGIAEVELLGEEEQEVIVETNPYLLEAYNVSTATISNRLQTYNRSISGGSISEMGLKYIIRGISEYQSLNDIQSVIITYKEQDQIAGAQVQGSVSENRIPVYLKELADVRFQNKEPLNIVRVDNNRCLGLAIYKEMKYNTVKAADDLTEELTALRKALPGYELTVIQNQANFINSAINEVEETAIIGIILAVIVLFVFLRRVGVTLIISVAIPISIVATFNLMYFKDLSLNIMTLGGLALGAGMLVDNAIVVMENIFRNIESGMPVKEAAITGTSEVGGAITASTITTIVVFLPIVYIHGAAGELFKDQAWTVAFSLISSLFVAIIVIPMLSAKFLRQQSINPDQFKSIQFNGYGRFLEKVLSAKYLVIAAAGVLIIITILILPMVGSEFIPRADQGEFSLEIKLPEGTDLSRTEQTVDGVEKVIRRLLGQDIKTIYSRIGPATSITTGVSSVFEDENTATMKIILMEKRRLSSQEILERVNAELSEIPDLEFQFTQEQTVLQSTMNTEIAPLVVEIKGTDLTEIQRLTEIAREQIAQVPELVNIETTFEEGRPQVDIVLDRMVAGLYNLNIDDLSAQLQDQLSGREAGEWDHEGEMKDITLRMPKIGINDLQDMIVTSGETKLPLSEVADIQYSNAPKEIIRRNQSRIGKITANLVGDKPFDRVMKTVDQRLKKMTFPVDYSYSITGEEQNRREAFQNLKFALMLSIILVYMVLASQFESLLHPFTIILTIPLAAVGAVFIFLIIGKPLNIMAYIGIIMLAGIAVNDSIILVDAINRSRREGVARYDAIIEAGQRRIRPIVMTSLTTILALLPLTFGFGEGAALRAPMAWAVIGGLLTSTLLTLVVIPCVYLIVDQLGDRLRFE